MIIGQAEIIQYLESIGNPVSVRQISEALGIDYTNLSHTIKKLLKYNEVGFIELDRIRAANFLGITKITRRMRFYFNIELVGKFNHLQ